MFNIMQRFIRILALAALFTIPLLPLQRAMAGFILGGGADQFAVLGQFSANQTNFNNGTITGDIGIGSPREFTASNGSVVGNIRFSGTAFTSGLTPNPDALANTGPAFTAAGPFTVSGGGTVSGNVVSHDSVVTSALNYMNALSQTLGGEAGTNQAITSGGSLNASSGMLDGTGNFVFTITSANFPNGAFTINGGASDYVVLNIGFSANLHGQILLAGGISTDHLLINMFGGDYTLHTGGPTLDVQTNGLSTYGVFLDPNGQMSATNTDLQGRFFGGDVHNQQLVSGVNITAPTTVPDPGATVLLMGLGLAFLAGAKKKFRS
jgi:hypothetical protein